MGYIRVDSNLIENGAIVDLLSDGTLFIKVRSTRAKAVEKERRAQQAPYRNILMAGRDLPPGVARTIGQKITANSVVLGVAGTLPDGSEVGKVVDGKPVTLDPVDPAHLIALFEEFPDFEEDVSSAAQANATFEREAVRDAEGNAQPTTHEAVVEAAGNSPLS